LAVHQAHCALVMGGRYLGINLKHTRLYQHAWQLGLRSLCCGIPAQQKKDERTHHMSHFEVSVDG